jgi:hypothetical protein
MPTLSRSPDISDIDPGPYIARVVDHLDGAFMGTLTVELLRDIGNTPKTTGQLCKVKYLSPFYGVTGIEYNTKNDDYNSTQKSYGMWMVPPDPGTLVMVIFVGGSIKNGFWIGCIQDEYMNFMIPGLAATSINNEGGDKKTVAEFNKKFEGQLDNDTTQIKKPVHIFQKVLEDQGLDKDETRGYTTSSARREVPSMVFGISTPGPVDRQGPKGFIGAEQSKGMTYVSRLGGSTFVMDDGDINFLRKTPASEGPPEYANVADGDTGEDKIPHNELIRLRTRTGHQIVLHNSEDLIYIGNARGTAWIEITSDGKIDIYAKDSISFRTEKDFNFRADRDINLESGRNINIKSNGEMHTHVVKDSILIVDKEQKIRIKGNYSAKFDANQTVNTDGNLNIKTQGHNRFSAGTTTEINSIGMHIETAAQIHMNGPEATIAEDILDLPQALRTHALPDEQGNELVKSIMRRMPTHEPWPQHEHLDPAKFKSEITDRDADARYLGNTTTMNVVPTAWKKELTLDTFKKIGK